MTLDSLDAYFFIFKLWEWISSCKIVFTATTEIYFISTLAFVCAVYVVAVVCLILVWLFLIYNKLYQIRCVPFEPVNITFIYIENMYKSLEIFINVKKLMVRSKKKIQKQTIALKILISVRTKYRVQL